MGDLIAASTRFDCGTPWWFAVRSSFSTPFVRDIRRLHEMRLALEGIENWDERLMQSDTYFKELDGYRKPGIVLLRRQQLYKAVERVINEGGKPRQLAGV